MSFSANVPDTLPHSLDAMPVDPSLFELIGPIVRLQVQTRSLKRGERPRSWYDPAAIRSLNAVRIDTGGVIGIDDETGDVIGDVHHRDHPASKHRAVNGVSLGFTSHYERMRDRFGDHVSDGVAGENIIVATDRIIGAEELDHGVVIATGDGAALLESAEIAKPCAEFSKFCAGYAPDQPPDRVITETLQFLHHGTRGFYLTYRRDRPRRIELSVGDLVYRRRPPTS